MANLHPNEKLITEFYSAFQNLDAEAMAACYHPDIEFSDPAFPKLKGPMASNMWRMLCAKAQDFELRFSDVSADDHAGSAQWQADYVFSQTGNNVQNQISATFEFKDGLIIRHQDHFDFWRWSRMALGPLGYLLGWTPFLQNKVQKMAAKNLASYCKKNGLSTG